MKNLLRKWLGIEEDVINISADMQMLGERTETTAIQVFELFHAMPYAAAAMSVTAADAAKLTLPAGIQANSIGAVLMGVILNARQGNSQMEVVGELPDSVRDILIARGFKVEETEGSGGKMTHIIWT